METTRLLQERHHIASIGCRIVSSQRGIRSISCGGVASDAASNANNAASHRDDAASPGSTLRRLQRRPRCIVPLRLLCARCDIASSRCGIAWLRCGIVRGESASSRYDAASYASVAVYPGEEPQLSERTAVRRWTCGNARVYRLSAADLDASAPGGAATSPSPEEPEMDTNVSIAQVLSEMETQIAHHESQEAFHAQQEVFHRDQRALHAETLAKERYEAF